MLIVTSALCVILGAILLCQSVSWATVAGFLARPRVTDWLIRRYAVPARAFPIIDDGELYMERFIIFNRGGGSEGSGNSEPVQFPWLPFSIRLHRICRPDADRHLHDHPAPFRSFVLRGWYEHEVDGMGDIEVNAGDTYVMRKGLYHRIFAVPPQGVWTLVIFGKRDTTWGFLVNGRKVPYTEYLATKPKTLTVADWHYVDEPDTERRA
jgi:hypothetical protein